MRKPIIAITPKTGTGNQEEQKYCYVFPNFIHCVSACGGIQTHRIYQERPSNVIPSVQQTLKKSSTMWTALSSAADRTSTRVCSEKS